MVTLYRRFFTCKTFLDAEVSIITDDFLAEGYT